MALSPEERQSQMALRDVGAPTAWIWLVDPDGYAKRVATGKNIQNGHTFVDGSGRSRLLGSLEESGWKFLQNAITSDEMRTWLHYHAQSDAVRGRMKPLADDMWPKGIKRPGSRNSTSAKLEYQPGAAAPAPPRGVTAGADADPGATTRGSTRKA